MKKVSFEENKTFNKQTLRDLLIFTKKAKINNYEF